MGKGWDKNMHSQKTPTYSVAGTKRKVSHPGPSLMGVLVVIVISLMKLWVHFIIKEYGYSGRVPPHSLLSWRVDERLTT